MVGVPGFEPGISWSQARRVKPFPNTPKNQKAPVILAEPGAWNLSEIVFQLRVGRETIGAQLRTFDESYRRRQCCPEMECLFHRTFLA